MATTKKAVKKSAAKSKSNPCWDGYEKIGMKTKKGKLVPNCVPVKKAAKKIAVKKKSS